MRYSKAALPAFNKVDLASQLSEAVVDVIGDIHQQIVQDFLPIYNAKQRESVNVAFEKLTKQLKKTAASDALELAEFIDRRVSSL